MARIPSDASAFLSATATTGEILHRGRTGGKKMPWKFQSSGDFGAPTKRTKSIAFHPLFHDIFMAAYADGDLALFDMAQSTTIRRWTLIDTGRDGNAPPERIASFAWSQQRPSVFYVLDERGRLWVWDLLVSEREAVKIVDVVEDIPVCAGRVLAVSNGSSTNSTMNGRSSKTVPMMALALDVCEKQSAPYYACIEVHVLDTTLTEHTIGDLECFRESIYR